MLVPIKIVAYNSHHKRYSYDAVLTSRP